MGIDVKLWEVLKLDVTAVLVLSIWYRCHLCRTAGVCRTITPLHPHMAILPSTSLGGVEGNEMSGIDSLIVLDVRYRFSHCTRDVSF